MVRHRDIEKLTLGASTQLNYCLGRSLVKAARQTVVIITKVCLWFQYVTTPPHSSIYPQVLPSYWSTPTTSIYRALTSISGWGYNQYLEAEAITRKIYPSFNREIII